MTVQEFSDEFDVLYNNITSNQAPGLNGYEKSVLLTQAQDYFVLDAYNGNSYSFESTEQITSYLSVLVKQAVLKNPISEENKIDTRSVVFKLPSDVWFITYESVILRDDLLGCENGKTAIVKGVKKLYGANVKATDLRGGAALVLAGSVAKGITKIQNIEYILRGYEDFVKKLQGLGLDIDIIKG